MSEMHFSLLAGFKLLSLVDGVILCVFWTLHIWKWKTHYAADKTIRSVSKFVLFNKRTDLNEIWRNYPMTRRTRSSYTTWRCPSSPGQVPLILPPQAHKSIPASTFLFFCLLTSYWWKCFAGGLEGFFVNHILPSERNLNHHQHLCWHIFSPMRSYWTKNRSKDRTWPIESGSIDPKILVIRGVCNEVKTTISSDSEELFFQD